MGAFEEVALVVLAVSAVLAAVWLARGLLLTPVKSRGSAALRLLVSTSGSCEGLDVVIRGLLWLRDSGRLEAEIVVVPRDLTPEGENYLSALSLVYGLTVCPAEELPLPGQFKAQKPADTI